MIDNPRSPRVRAVAKLAKKKARRSTGQFLLEGPQAVTEALRSRPDLVVDIFATGDAVTTHPNLDRLARDAGVPIAAVSESVVGAMADTVTPQGVVAVAKQAFASLTDIVALRPRLVAILEEVRDPGNAGTILRAADAAGADAVIFSDDSVDPYHPKVVRSTTGSIFHVLVVAGVELADAVAAMHRAALAVIAADVAGDDLLTAELDLSAPTAWLFGNEARGLDDLQRARADRAIRLPIFGRAESLNLATAASVFLYQSALAQAGESRR